MRPLSWQNRITFARKYAGQHAERETEIELTIYLAKKSFFIGLKLAKGHLF